MWVGVRSRYVEVGLRFRAFLLSVRPSLSDNIHFLYHLFVYIWFDSWFSPKLQMVCVQYLPQTWY